MKMRIQMPTQVVIVADASARLGLRTLGDV